MRTTGDRTDGPVALLLLGAGSGIRLGQPLPKALVKVDGQPLLTHALSCVARIEAITDVVITAPATHVAAFEEIAAVALRNATASAGTPVAATAGTGLPCHPACDQAVRVVAGGVARSDSVAMALGELPDNIELVLVHDVARALAPESLINSVISALRSNPGADAVVPGLPVTDTIKVVDLVGGHDGGHGELELPDPNGGTPNCGGPTRDLTAANGGELVLATLDRNALRAAQTPQGFRLASLRSALRDVEARRDATDDADLVARIGGSVVVVAGSAAAFKITHPWDLMIAEALCADRRKHEHATAAYPAGSGSG